MWQSVQEPFGEITESVSTVDQNLRFPGQYFDRETGLHYNYFRDYDSWIGRYVESDPIGLSGGLISYAYSKNSPPNYIDPYGLFRICRRPLTGLGNWVSSGRTGLDLGLFHEYGFYENGEKTGFTRSGLFEESTMSPDYQCDADQYDDAAMREAEQQLREKWEQEKYNMFTNKCQDDIAELLDVYKGRKCYMTPSGLRCS